MIERKHKFFAIVAFFPYHFQVRVEDMIEEAFIMIKIHHIIIKILPLRLSLRLRFKKFLSIISVAIQ